MAISKEKPNEFLVTRSGLDGKVERVFVTTKENRERKHFLRAASLKAVPKRSILSRKKAKSAVQKYFKEHAIEAPISGP